jgi:hypothetical protein
MAGQPFVNAASYVTHLRQPLHQQPLAFTVILAAGHSTLALFGHGSLPATAPEAVLLGAA